MNVSTQAVQGPVLGAPQGAPKCFGKEWSSTATECAGGPDYSFTDERGKHVRPRCGSFGMCGSATAAAKQVLITPQSMIRPPPSIHLPPEQQPRPAFTPQPPMQAQPQDTLPRPVWTPPVMHPPVAPLSVATDWRTTEQQRQAGLAARALPPPVHVPMPPQYTQLAAPVPAHYPAQTWQVGNAMPPYLTHEEERRPGESWFIALFFSLVRGMLKAFGHSFARYVDVTPFREPPRS